MLGKVTIFTHGTSVLLADINVNINAYGVKLYKPFGQA